MKKETIYFVFLIALITIGFTNCKNEEPVSEEPENEYLVITKDQFQMVDMAFGTPEYNLFAKTFMATGRIVPQVDGVAEVSAPINGIVMGINVREGQFVKAGDVILEIGGSFLIDLQKAYATSNARIMQLRSEYERVKALYLENIKTENEFLKAESAFKAELANHSALQINLKQVGLDSDKVARSEYTSTYAITSPIDGQVTNINTTLGQFVSQQLTLIKVVNGEKIQLRLNVFERDYNKVISGQKVLFRHAGEEDFNAKATITHVSRVLNQEAKSFDCYADINPEYQRDYIIYQLVRGVVQLEVDTVNAVPETAIATYNGSSYLFVKHSEDNDHYYLNKIKVNTGRTSNGNVEILDDLSGRTILLKGSYNISSE